jgi:hypothetical protein
VHDALAILSRYPCRCGSRCRRGAPSRSRPSRHQRLGVVAPCALAESPLASGALHLLVPWVATVCQTGSALLAQPVACGDPLSSPRLKPGASSGDEGERHAAQAVFARSHALRGGCGDTRRVRHRPPGPGHPLPHRGRAQPPAAGEAPRRVPHALWRPCPPGTDIAAIVCAAGPHIRLKLEAGRQGHRTVDRSWWISLPTVCVWSLSCDHRLPGPLPQ